MNQSGADLDNGKSILAYDDIEAVCLPGKIEAYFEETNKMFTSKFGSTFVSENFSIHDLIIY